MNTVNQLKKDITNWQNETFGVQLNPVSKLYHLKEEIKELLKASKELYCSSKRNKDYLKLRLSMQEEFADCFMLILGAASNACIDMDLLIELTYTKLEINKKRDWDKPDKNGVCKHI